MSATYDMETEEIIKKATCCPGCFFHFHEMNDTQIVHTILSKMSYQDWISLEGAPWQSKLAHIAKFGTCVVCGRVSTPTSTQTSGGMGVSKYHGEMLDAGYRIAGNQIVRTVQSAARAAVLRNLPAGGASIRERVGEFLASGGGKFIVTAVSATFATALPLEGAVKQRIARHLRIETLALGGDAIAEIVMAPLRHVLAQVRGTDAGPGLPEPQSNPLVEGLRQAESMDHNTSK